MHAVTARYIGLRTWRYTPVTTSSWVGATPLLLYAQRLPRGISAEPSIPVQGPGQDRAKSHMRWMRSPGNAAPDGAEESRGA